VHHTSHALGGWRTVQHANSSRPLVLLLKHIAPPG
jgi:hypothetical protein